VPISPVRRGEGSRSRDLLPVAERHCLRNSSRGGTVLLLIGFLALLPASVHHIHADGGDGQVSASFHVTEKAPVVLYLPSVRRASIPTAPDLTNLYLPCVRRANPTTMTGQLPGTSSEIRGANKPPWPATKLDFGVLLPLSGSKAMDWAVSAFQSAYLPAAGLILTALTGGLLLRRSRPRDPD
jgi:hypothetical protein